jgi:CheY-like chemotaxis protein
MKSIHILLVEDNAGDILLTTETLEESKIINRITVIKDGRAAIDYFKNLVNKNDAPDLVLLDINLPKENGHEVLRFIKKDESLSHIPVIMLTTSSLERDMLSAYKYYANCYITKPVEIAEFIAAITKIEDFWFNIVSTPSQGD